MDHKEWIARVAGTTTWELSVNAVAETSGLVQSTLSRRLAGEGLSAEQVIAIARAYRADVIDALIELGFVTEEDLVRPAAAATLADASDEEIVAEVGRRILAGSASDAYDRPVTMSAVPDSLDDVPAEESLAADTSPEESEQ